MSTHAIILAGGSGTRFWPLSRSKNPKQFLALATPRTLIRETYERTLPLCDAQHSWVVCGAGHAERVRSELPELPSSHVVVEPSARNTAPAIGLAAVHALREDPEAMLIILPSDHHVARPDAFCASLKVAVRAAQDGTLVTLGIAPTRPETGFGYLLRGGARGEGAFAVDSFVEKPDAPTAARYLADGRYLWNAGIFVFKARAYLDAVERYLPKMAAGLAEIAKDPSCTARVFPELQSISIDYGVMEAEGKATRKIALVPGDFGWSDVGSFAALPEVRSLDARGNAVSGDAIVVDSDGCVVLSEGKRLVAAVGVRDLCIIDSGDALLIVPKERAQDVRAVVDALKAAKRDDKL